MFNKKINSIQEWFCIDDILEDGIIITKENSRVKILKVEPINFFLRSEMEKEVILNSYKNIFKSINFDIQIIIQSTKEDLSSNINYIKSKEISNKKLLNQYIEYIESLNQIKKSNNKNFYLIVKETSEQNSINEKISKIQDLLERCGNKSYVVNSKEEVIKIIETFYKIRRIE
jgi:H2-forming N5,N10-methylenetetrahydromethanopterin dehydrogenase-like enzyme